MTTTGVAIGQLSEAEHGRQLRRAIVASTIGTIIEAYDFLLYVLVAPLVFATLYFPESDPLVGILQAFGIYAVGFIARPFGAAIFGHFGDRLGRRAAVVRAHGSHPDHQDEGQADQDEHHQGGAEERREDAPPGAVPRGACESGDGPAPRASRWISDRRP